MTPISDPLNHRGCTKCALQNLESHLRYLEDELIRPKPWLYTHRHTWQCNSPIDDDQSFANILNFTFSEGMRTKTIEQLHAFDQQISHLRPKRHDESVTAGQSLSQQNPPSVPLEDVYNTFPSLHALVTLHGHDFFHLPEYATRVRSWWAFGFCGKMQFSWRPCLCKEQLEFSSTSQRMKKAWEALQKSGPTASGQTSSHQVKAVPATPPVASNSKRGISKMNRSSNDWSY